MESSKRLRLFVAVDVPPAHLDEVERATNALRRTLEDARWTAKSNQHITLKFLGWCDPGLLSAIESGCESVAATLPSQGDLALGELGAFPSARRASVLWVGVTDPARVLTRAAAALDDAFAPLGFVPEKRPFTPHLTLARLKRPARVEPLPQLGLGAGEFPVPPLGLWRSHLARTGPTYELLRSFPAPP